MDKCKLVFNLCDCIKNFMKNDVRFNLIKTNTNILEFYRNQLLTRKKAG